MKVVKKGQRKSVYLTPRGKAIVSGQIPIKIRGLGLFDVKKMSVINKNRGQTDGGEVK